MLPRRQFHPEAHLSTDNPLNHSDGIRCGELILVGGQADIDATAKVTCSNDLDAQTQIAMTNVCSVLSGTGADAGDLVKITVFYVLREERDESRILEIIASNLSHQQKPGPTITLVPIEAHCFNGLLIEIEAIAMRGQNGERLGRSAAWIADGSVLPRAFSQALRCRQMIFTSGQTAADETATVVAPGKLIEQGNVVLDKLQRLLKALGADLFDAVKANVFNVEAGKKEDWKAAALQRASHFREPGPAATGLSLSRLAKPGVMICYDVIAMRAEDGTRLQRESAWPDGHWDWPVHLPYRHGLRVGDLVFLGGQVSLNSAGVVLDPADIESQTSTAMTNIQKVLEELGLGLEHIVKINTFYVGSGGEKDLWKNASIRSRFYKGPGPVSTGIPFPHLAYEDMIIEIDCIAMV